MLQKTFLIASLVLFCFSVQAEPENGKGACVAFGGPGYAFPFAQSPTVGEGYAKKNQNTNSLEELRFRCDQDTWNGTIRQFCQKNRGILYRLYLVAYGSDGSPANLECVGSDGSGRCNTHYCVQ